MVSKAPCMRGPPLGRPQPHPWCASCHLVRQGQAAQQAAAGGAACQRHEEVQRLPTRQGHLPGWVGAGAALGARRN